jgi:hypothetical protein
MLGVFCVLLPQARDESLRMRMDHDIRSLVVFFKDSLAVEMKDDKLIPVKINIEIIVRILARSACCWHLVQVVRMPVSSPVRKGR